MKRRPIAERLFERVTKTSTCWVFTGRLRNGYGLIGEGGKGGRTRSAHRVAYELLVGPIPDGLVIDHLCRNRACVNPSHLQPVTQRVNVHRGLAPAAKNAVLTVCQKGLHDLVDSNVCIDEGKRRCRTCRNEWYRARYFRRRELGSQESAA